MIEKTLILIKPDAVEQKHIGNIIKRIEKKGYKINNLKQINATDELLKEHYKEHVGKVYFNSLLNYMKRTPIIALEIVGVDVVLGVRTMSGSTNPTKAEPGTIRGDYGTAVENGGIENVIHSSDSIESAKRELSIWF